MDRPPPPLPPPGTPPPPPGRGWRLLWLVPIGCVAVVTALLLVVGVLYVLVKFILSLHLEQWL